MQQVFTDESLTRADRASRLISGRDVLFGASQTTKQYHADGYVNVLNQYGTQNDTTEQYEYSPEGSVMDIKLNQLYEGDGLFAKIIDTPADECVKQGFSFGNLSDEKVESFLRQSLDDLDWEDIFSTAVKWSRLFGGAIGVMLIDDGGELDEPLNWSSIKSIDEVRIYERAIVQPDYTSLYRINPQYDGGSRVQSKFGMPQYYTVMSQYGSFVVHESRCLVFRNGRLPERTSNPLYQIWGMPEYIRIKRAMRDATVAHGDATKLLERSVQAVYSMKGLADECSTEEGENRILKRLQTIDTSRGLMNTISIDADGENYDFKTFSFSGVSDVVDTSCNLLSALTNIPQTILFGRSPAGMSATGESDMENFYNFVERIQKTMLRPNLQVLLDVIIQAGVHAGELDKAPDIHLEFNPLWSLSEAEQAQVEATKAATASTRANTAIAYVNSQILDPTEVRRKLADSGEFNVEDIITEDDIDEDDILNAMNAPTQQSANPAIEGELVGKQPQLQQTAAQPQLQQPAQQKAMQPTTKAQAEDGESTRHSWDSADYNDDDFNSDYDKPSKELDWITVNGTHTPLQEGKAIGGGKLSGKDFSKATVHMKTAKTALSAASNVSKKYASLNDKASSTLSSNKSEADKASELSKMFQECESGTTFKFGNTEYRKTNNPEAPFETIDSSGNHLRYCRHVEDWDINGAIAGKSGYELEFFDKEEQLNNRKETAAKMKESGKFSTSEEVHSQKEGKITDTSSDFGKPGNYVVYRNGAINRNGMIFLSPKKETADTYSSQHDEGNTSQYEVQISNPLIVKGETDGECLRNAYEALHPGSEFKGPVTESKWVSTDNKNAAALDKGVGGHDSILYIRNGKPWEVQISAKKAKSELQKTGEFTTTKWSRTGRTYEQAVMAGMIDETAEDYKKVNSDGGPGSGNFGHAGREGEVGGSAPSAESLNSTMSAACKASKDGDKDKAYSLAEKFLSDVPVGSTIKMQSWNDECPELKKIDNNVYQNTLTGEKLDKDSALAQYDYSDTDDDSMRVTEVGSGSDDTAASSDLDRGLAWGEKISEEREKMSAAKPAKQAMMLNDAHFLSYDDAVKAMKDGTAGEKLNDYFDIMDENGDPTPTKPVSKQLLGFGSNVSEEYAGDWSNARLGYIEKYTGQSKEQAEKTKSELDTWFGGGWSKADTATLDKYIDEDHAYDGELYRGLHFENDGDFDSFIAQCEPGAVITNKNGMNSSWSSSEGMARNFAHSANKAVDSVVLHCVKNRTTSPVSYLSSKGEDECLSHSKAQWTVLRTDISETGQGGRKADVYVVEKGEYAE